MNAINDLKAYIINLPADSRRVPAVRDMLARQGCVVRHQTLTTATAAGEVDRFQQTILLPQIQWADVLVVLIPAGTKNDPMIAWAVQCALGLGKRVVGIWDEEEVDGVVPTILDDYANAVVPMMSEMVIGAVGGTDGICGPDGKQGTDRVIERHNC